MRHRQILAFLAVTLALATATGATTSYRGVTDRHVQERMTSMAEAQTALEQLGHMISGRMPFHRPTARAARKALIAETRSTEKLFRKPHFDRHSKARTEIWTRWDDFEARADIARKAARNIDVSNRDKLRVSLTPVLQSCLSCHDSYRDARR